MATTMASTDIQVVNIPNLTKIEAFLNDTAYRELLENSETYNTRLCIERRLRMPFLDQQTGVAQTHCALFMKRRQRMPGLRDGQIYTFPSAKWRKSKRQYLLHHHRPFRMVREPDTESIPGLDRSSFGTGDSESKDSHPEPKEWFYTDDMEMHDVVDAFEDRGDSDFDYDDNHYKKKRRNRKSGNVEKLNSAGRGGGSRGGRGSRGRRNRNGDVDSPKTSGSRRRTGGGASSSNNFGQSPSMGPSGSNSPLNMNEDSQPSLPGFGLDQPHMSLPASIPSTVASIASNSADEDEERMRLIRKPTERAKAPPSPYCDFCLGDARENKKTNIPEELVSCSDCGRSGHPSCLQFTPNMIISVKRYRWQCIECKYCSMCGTSDNDDQLLFCDDCDRGYHMYCLSPPLTAPPEGSWSCEICTKEFHSSK